MSSWYRMLKIMQVLSGILPISKISAIPACINYISQLLPLERVYNLSHPVSSEVPVEDKRTWREGMQPPKPKPAQWTAMDILTAYANVKGWVTAKAGRPDVHRAGNASECTIPFQVVANILVSSTSLTF